MGPPGCPNTWPRIGRVRAEGAPALRKPTTASVREPLRQCLLHCMLTVPIFFRSTKYNAAYCSWHARHCPVDTISQVHKRFPLLLYIK